MNFFKSFRNRFTYLMNQASSHFTLTLLMRIAQTMKAYSELPNNPLAKKEEFSFPNYRDKWKLANDICGFFVWKIDRIRSGVDDVGIDPSARNALPPDQEIYAANAFHSFLSRKATFLRSSASSALTLLLSLWQQIWGHGSILTWISRNRSTTLANLGFPFIQCWVYPKVSVPGICTHFSPCFYHWSYRLLRQPSIWFTLCSST